MMGVIGMSEINVASPLKVLNEIGPIQVKAEQWIGQIGLLGFSEAFLAAHRMGWERGQAPMSGV